MHLVPLPHRVAPPALLAPELPALRRLPEFPNCSVVSHRQLRWAGLQADLVSYRCLGPFSADLTAEATRLFAVLESVGAPVRFGPRCCAPTLRAGVLSVVEGGETVWAVADGLRYLRLLVVSFDQDALRERLRDRVRLEAAFASHLMFNDAVMLRLAQLLASVCEQDAEGASLYGDSLAIALAVALSRLDRRVVPARGGLASKQLKQVLGWLTANLDQELPLPRLAGMAGLSISHFSRAFKASTGLSPRNWFIGARVERAQALLLEGRVPLAQIAVMLGFVDQAHFTRTFSRVVGVSPAQWRHRHH